MNNSLTHLPEKKQTELQQIVSVICEMCDDVEMVILFGSYARGDYRESDDLAPDRKSGHVSDYDILVVSGQKETADNTILWDKVTEAAKALDLSAQPRIIVHDIQELNIKLAERQYFFFDIKKEGRLLFNSDRYQLANERELTNDERLRIAQDYFEHWLERAKGSFSGYHKFVELEEYNWAAFHLHQSSEACFKAILLVFTNYNPNEHWLASLNDMVMDEVPSFENVFPRNTKEEKDRFILLDYAYIGARYDPKYRISKNNLEILSENVSRLLELTEKFCNKKIEALKSACP